MTILKTKWGEEINTDELPQGYGHFTKFVQENFDKNFGKGTDTKPKYNVTINARREVNVYTEVTVEAEDRKEAEKIALEQVRKDKYGFTWNDYCNGDEFIDSIEVDSVEEVEDEDD